MQQPESQTATAGQAATFTVTAIGAAPLSYRWYMNGAGVGTNSSTFVISGTSIAQNGAQIYVNVTDPVTTVQSTVVSLTVNSAPTAPAITQQPASQTVPAGQSASFSVAADGAAPLTYQWFMNGAPAGMNSSAFSIPQSSTAQTGAQIYVKVTNAQGSATSNIVILTVTQAATPPVITQQPASVTVTAGQAAAFSITATGTAPLTYQWFMRATSVGTNSNTYSISQTASGQNDAQIYVKATNAQGSATSNIVILTVNQAITAPVITQQPANITVTAGQAAAFSITATGTPPLTYEWFMSGIAVGTNLDAYSISQATSAQNGAQIYATTTNSAGRATSVTVTLTVDPVTPINNAKVLTYHNDIMRTGQNLAETILTPANVNFTNFGQLGYLFADASVDAEPLYVSNLTVGASQHNALFVVTENDTVYAFDADTFALLWQVSVLGANETASDSRNCAQVAPIMGITSTPVIDLQAGSHGEIFLVAMSKDDGGDYHQRLHALDISSGAEVTGSPTTVQATFPNRSGITTFDPKQYKERAALLLLNGVVYTTWASICDTPPYRGWLIGYNQSSLLQSSVLNITPNGGEGAIWMTGDGPAADSSGNIYFLDANGTFDGTLDSNGFPEYGDYGNAFMKISTASSTLSVADYFTMYDTTAESEADVDLGSGGEMLLPDIHDPRGNTWHLAVGAGKDSHIYVVNRDLMGKFNTNNDSGIYQEIDSNGLSGGVWSSPAYFNNTVYYGASGYQGASGDELKAFTISNAKLLVPPSSQSSVKFQYPGATPSVSANGTSNGIVWVIQNSSGGGVLRAYDATNLATELYDSNQAANGRDHFSDNKFITPMIANGKVYVGTPYGVVVFGLF